MVFIIASVLTFVKLSIPKVCSKPCGYRQKTTKLTGTIYKW